MWASATSKRSAKDGWSNLRRSQEWRAIRACIRIDTNIYLDWWVRRYPEDIFPTYRAQVEGLIAASKWNAVERVEVEINHVGTGPLKTWAKNHRRQFIKHDAALIAEANAITRAYPGIIDPYARHDEADRYVIALAP